MKDQETIIKERLEQASNNKERNKLVKGFEEELSAYNEAQRKQCEQELIAILENKKDKHRVIRSYAALFLGILEDSKKERNIPRKEKGITTEEKDPFDVLCERIKDPEENDVVKQWAVRILIRHFSKRKPKHSKNIPEWVIEKQVKGTKVIYNKWVALTELSNIEPDNFPGQEKTIETFIDYANDDYELIRDACARGLWKYHEYLDSKQGRAVKKLLEHLQRDVEESSTELDVSILRSIYEEKRIVAEALATIGDKAAISPVIEELKKLPKKKEYANLKDDQEQLLYRITLIRALREIGRQNKKEFAKENKEKVLKALVSEACLAPDRRITLVASYALEQLSSPENRVIPRKEIISDLINEAMDYDDHSETFRKKIANALRLIDQKLAVKQLKEYEDQDQWELCKDLIARIGGMEAVSTLAKQFKDANTKWQNIMEVVQKGINKTMNQAYSGYDLNKSFSIALFMVGVIIVLFSLAAIFDAQSPIFYQNSGFIGLISGIVTMVAIFYKGPLKQIDQSTTTLVQTQLAFISYLNQIFKNNLILQKAAETMSFNDSNVQKIMRLTQDNIEKIMMLVNKYTLQKDGQAIFHTMLSDMREQLYRLEHQTNTNKQDSNGIFKHQEEHH